MVALRIDDQYIDLGNAAINFTFKNPIFDSDGLPKSYSYPFSILATPLNQRAFRYANRLDSNDGSPKYSAIFTLLGTDIKGYLQVSNTTAESYKCTFVNESKDFSNLLTKITLKDLITETFELTSNNPAFWEIQADALLTGSVIGLDINHTEYRYTVLASDNVFSALGALEQLIEADHGNICFLKSSGNGAALEMTVGLEVGEFYVKLNPVGTTAFNIITARYQHEAFEEAWITLMESTLPNDGDFIFPTIRNFGAYENNNYKFLGDINARINQEYSINPAHFTGEWLRTISPQIRLPFILDKIAAFLEVNFTGDWYNVDAQDLFAFSPRILDNEIEDHQGFYNIFGNTFKYIDQLPEKTNALQLLKLLHQSLFFYYKLEGNQLHTIPIAPILQQPPQDLTAYANFTYDQGTKNTNGLTIKLQEEEEDKHALTAFDNHIIPGTAATPYSSSGKGATMELLGTISGNGLQFAQVEQLHDEDYIFRIGKWYGVNQNGNPISGAYTTPESTYQDNQKLIDLKHFSKTASFSMSLPISKLIKLILFENPNCVIRHSEGQVVGTISQISFRAKENNISNIRITIKSL